jgi:hypothetical protein
MSTCAALLLRGPDFRDPRIRCMSLDRCQSSRVRGSKLRIPCIECPFPRATVLPLAGLLQVRYWKQMAYIAHQDLGTFSSLAAIMTECRRLAEQSISHIRHLSYFLFQWS